MSPVVLAVKNITERTMEQYLGQFVGIIVSSLHSEGLTSTIFSGFLVLAGATILAYMAFKILLLAFKVGLVVAALTAIASVGFPTIDQSSGKPKQNPPAKKIENAQEHNSQFSMSDLSAYISEEKLRGIFLNYLRDINS